MKFKNIIAAGCSFTADGIGGVPPSDNNQGGNSFIDYAEHTASEPMSWASFVAADLQPVSFVNVSGHGHGNIMSTIAVHDVFTRYKYQPDNTLVMFNITGLERMDYVCGWNNPHRSGLVSWTSALLPYTFIGSIKPIMREMQRNQGLDTIPYQTTKALEMFMFWLDHMNIPYVFTMMMDYLADPILKTVIEPRRSRLVTFDGHNSMFDYVSAKNMLAIDQQHPSRQGHRMIADFAIEKISLLS